MTNGNGGRYNAGGIFHVRSAPAGDARPRNVRVEALRLAAIIGISLFHTMMPWTSQALCGLDVGCGEIGEMLGSNPAMLVVLGGIAQLGAWGNHVFFMISGFYLVPALARRSTRPGYWRASALATERRVLAIVVSVALVAVFALAFDAWIVPLVNVRMVWQWTLGLEFVWLYAAFVAVAPVLAWVLRRVPAQARVVAVCVAVAVLVVLNGYIAFVSPGEAARGLTDWRKWMSAITYAVSFALAGIAGMGQAPSVEELPRRRRCWLTAAATVVVVLVAVEVACAVRGDVALLGALSYKSTSAAAMALAFLLLMACAMGAGDAGEDLSSASRGAGVSDCVAARVTTWLASGILGFYIVQSVFSSVVMDAGIQSVMGAVAFVGGGWALVVVAVVLSTVYVVAVAVLDGVIRRPLLRWMRLG